VNCPGKEKENILKTIFLDYKEVFPTLALEFGVPGVGIPPGILASNRVPLPFNRVGDCLKVVSEDCFRYGNES